MSLTAARKARDVAKLQEAEGRDPVQARKMAKLKAKVVESDTFRATVLEWFGKHLSRWSTHYAIREKRNLEACEAGQFVPYGASAAGSSGDLEAIISTASRGMIRARCNCASKIAMCEGELSSRNPEPSASPPFFNSTHMYLDFAQPFLNSVASRSACALPSASPIAAGVTITAVHTRRRTGTTVATRKAPTMERARR
ncbi:hypothetical protein ACSFA8_04845 [Variovorax sp. RT4R15]|uniref:hypothetical protein n=1 Tax=Variovorax sp. RT4R15 TaxID=3443737 RepID=UPI003F466D7F